MTSEYSLGYLRFEVSNLAGWGALLTDVIGLSVAESVGSAQHFRLDSYASRIQLYEGPLDDVAAVGIVARSLTAFDAAINRLSIGNVSIAEGSKAEASERRVERFARFCDSDGTPVELAVGQAQAAHPFKSPMISHGFDAEDAGIGHIVLRSTNLDESFRFYRESFNGRVSDIASQNIMGVEPLVGFMALGSRHHSLGWLDRVPYPKQTVHFALEVHDRQDVGAAYDRARDAGVPIFQELGMHPDNAFSFYVTTPSGFPLEIGADTIKLTDDWKPRKLNQFSLWGHRRVGTAAASSEKSS